MRQNTCGSPVSTVLVKAAVFVTKKEKWKYPLLNECAVIATALAVFTAGTRAGRVFGENMTESGPVNNLLIIS